MGEYCRVFGVMCHFQRAVFEKVRSLIGDQPLHPRQGPILAMILHNTGIGQAELVKKLNVSAATVAVSVARLEKLGLLTRERDLHNRRANVLCLTEAGREQAQRLENAMQEVQRIAFAGLADEELSHMGDCFERMLFNLQGDDSNGKEGTSQP